MGLIFIKINPGGSFSNGVVFPTATPGLLYFNPSCTSPPELCKLPDCVTNVSFFKKVFPTMADYCFA